MPAPPAGRAYEIVSPLDKNGGDIDPFEITRSTFSLAAVDPSGDGIAYGSVANFTGQQGAGLVTQYRSRRMPTGWTTQAVSPPFDPPAASQDANTTARVFALSSDLSRAVVTTNRQLDDGADLLGIASGLYLEHLTPTERSYQLLNRPVALLPPENVFENLYFQRFIFAAANSDLSSVVFSGNDRSLMPEADPFGLYQWVRGELRLVSVLPDGTSVAAVAGARTPQYNGLFHVGDHAVSRDASRVFFTTGTDGVSGLPVALYVREHIGSGSRTTLISGSERAGDDPTAPLSATFEGAAAADGARAVFTSSNRLTDDATASGGILGDLYLWSADADEDGHHLTDLTTSDADGGEVLAVAAVSDDLSHVYFVANGNLAPGAIDGDCGSPIFGGNPGERCNLYLWTSAGGIEHVAVLDGADDAVWSVNRATVASDPTIRGRNLYRDARISGRGSRLLFRSSNRLTAFDNAGHQQAYLYDGDAGTLSCVSCPRVSQVADSPASLNLAFDVAQQMPIDLPRNLSADGSHAFFQTESRLVPEDTNGRRDVYMWHNGDLSLISTGQGNADADFIGASASGGDVFFTTRQRLASSDTDEQVDMYDARVGGGFALPPPPPTPCAGDDCQGLPSRRPGAVAAGSELLLPGGRRSPAARASFDMRKLTRPQLARLARGRKVSLKVRVDRAGRVSAIATARLGKRTRTVASASRRVSKPGTVKLPIRLRGSARAWLTQARKLKVALAIRFSAARSPERATLNLRLPVGTRRVSRMANAYGRKTR